MSEITKKEKNAALLVAAFASFLTPFMGSSINVALPTIGIEFKSGAILLSWIATSYLLAAAVFLIPLGRIADIIGRKKIFIWGIFLFTVSSFLCGIAPSVHILILFRVLQAIGSAMIFGTGMAIVTSVFQPHERGKAMGIVVAAVYTGLAFGPFAGGILTQHLGWRSLFFFMVPIGLTVIYVAMRNLKGEWADSKGERFDWQGSILYAIALILIMSGFPKLPSINGFLFLASGLLILLAFIAWELKTDFPVLELSLFKTNIIFRYSSLAALINYSATFAVAFILSLYLHHFKGLTPQQTGMILITSPIVMASLSPYIGRLSDRVEARILASLGMTLTTIGLIAFVFLTAQTNIIFIVLNLLMMGVGFALFSTPNNNAVMSSVERKYLGVASGSLGTMRLVGQMLSMGIAMMLFALFIGKEEINSSNIKSFLSAIQVSFAVFAVLCIFGVFASLARGKKVIN